MAIVDIHNDIFTSRSVFWIFKITLWISGMVFHFGYLKLTYWPVTIGLYISEMGVFPLVRIVLQMSRMDIKNVTVDIWNEKPNTHVVVWMEEAWEPVPNHINIQKHIYLEKHVSQVPAQWTSASSSYNETEILFYFLSPPPQMKQTKLHVYKWGFNENKQINKIKPAWVRLSLGKQKHD